MLHGGVLHHPSRALAAHGTAGSSLGKGRLAAHGGELLGVEHHLLLLALLLLALLLLTLLLSLTLLLALSAGRASLARLLLHVDVLLLAVLLLVVELRKSGSLGVGEAIATGWVHGHAYVLLPLPLPKLGGPTGPWEAVWGRAGGGPLKGRSGKGRRGARGGGYHRGEGGGRERVGEGRATGCYLDSSPGGVALSGGGNAACMRE